MAIVTAWWGIWHIVVSMTLALYWKRRDPAAPRPSRPQEPRHDGPPRTRHGACGYLGRQVVARLADPALENRPDLVVAHDIRAPAERLPGVVYEEADIRDPRIADALAQHRIDTVVHLASIVTPGKDSRRDFEYDVDVNGTRNLLQACVQQGVQRIVVSSSGAAYGYHADSPAWLTEKHARARQRGVCLCLPQAPRGRNAGRVPPQPPGAGTGGAAHRHHPGRHGAQPDHRPV